MPDIIICGTSHEKHQIKRQPERKNLQRKSGGLNCLWYGTTTSKFADAFVLHAWVEGPVQSAARCPVHNWGKLCYGHITSWSNHQDQSFKILFAKIRILLWFIKSISLFKTNIISSNASYVNGENPGEVTLNCTTAVQQAAQSFLKVNKLSEELATASAEAIRQARV